MFQLPVNTAVMMQDSLLLVRLNKVQYINNIDVDDNVTAGIGAKLFPVRKCAGEIFCLQVAGICVYSLRTKNALC